VLFSIFLKLFFVYSWLVPLTVVTATAGTMTTVYSQVAAGGTTGGGGGVLSSTMKHTITQWPHGSHTHRRPHRKVENRGW